MSHIKKNKKSSTVIYRLPHETEEIIDDPYYDNVVHPTLVEESNREWERREEYSN